MPVKRYAWRNELLHLLGLEKTERIRNKESLLETKGGRLEGVHGWIRSKMTKHNRGPGTECS